MGSCVLFGEHLLRRGDRSGVVECLVSDWRGGGDMDLEIREC